MRILGYDFRFYIFSREGMAFYTIRHTYTKMLRNIAEVVEGQQLHHMIRAQVLEGQIISHQF